MSDAKLNVLLKLLIVLSIIISLISSFYFQKDYFLSNDNEQHFYEMRTAHDNKEIPHTGARLVTSGLLVDDIARVPGAGFYSKFLLLFNLGGENYYTARIIDVSLYLLVLFIFLIWIYFRFGFVSAAIMTSFMAVNCIIFEAVTSFTNPNPVVMFSFLFCMFFVEYLRDEKYSKVFASLLFPVLAIMGQFHFAVYYGIVPTLLVYLIIKRDYSKKYFKYLALGVFISFLLYLPYLIAEIQNGFNNSLKMINLSKGYTVPFYKRFPQIYAQIIFPTFTLNKFDVKTALTYWGIFSPIVIITIIVSHVIVIASFVYSIMFLYKKDLFRGKRFKNDAVLKEVLFFYFLYIPVAILCPMILKGKGGGYVYHFSMFALSFFTILLFTNYLYYEKTKLFNLLIIFMFIHILAVPWHYYKQNDYFSLIGKKQRLTYDIVKNMAKDADGKPFTLYSRNIFNYAMNLFLTKKENAYTNQDYKIEYLITENTNSSLYAKDDSNIKIIPHHNLSLYYWYSTSNKPDFDDNSEQFLFDSNSVLIYTNELFNLYRKKLN
ncbi:hypothetical protein BFL38_08065 [Brachyspira hampsonii]|uniref:Uncharacterized protein n=1 Tax=Brachyspira hampsonii TaxID=1287055 RepID=A0A1E5NF68_9SPIR|nr:glycosyltransferase family 39 protein [Brachyspira hampsonii]OEJ14783.1 hypothetical protein BFL38_08065 [Brachyspira hampsonii]